MPDTFFSLRTWLNPPESPHTSSLVCYDGEYLTDEGKIEPWSFIELADCHTKVRLHNYRGDANQSAAYIQKLKKIRDNLSMFIEHLESK